MLMSNRVKDIIQIVLSSRGFVTMKDIANKMNVSERTVYREIPEVTEVLRQYQITLETVSKKGTGLSVCLNIFRNSRQN